MCRGARWSAAAGEQTEHSRLQWPTLEDLEVESLKLRREGRHVLDHMQLVLVVVRPTHPRSPSPRLGCRPEVNQQLHMHATRLSAKPLIPPPSPPHPAAKSADLQQVLSNGCTWPGSFQMRTASHTTACSEAKKEVPSARLGRGAGEVTSRPCPEPRRPAGGPR